MKVFCCIALMLWPLLVAGIAYAVRDAALKGDKVQEQFNLCAFLISWAAQIGLVIGAAQL